MSNSTEMRGWILSFLEYLKVERGYSLHTITNYEIDLEAFHKFLETQSITFFTDVTHSVIRTYLVELYEKHYSKTTVSRHISTLRSFFSYLSFQKQVAENPMLLISSPKLDQRLPNYLSISEVEDLLHLPDVNTSLGLRDALILELLYASGMRVSELISIQMPMIQFAERKIKITGKGSKDRYVFYGSRASKLMERYLCIRQELLQGKESPYLLLNFRGGHLTVRSIQYMIDKYAKLAQIPRKITPHVLRHTYATHLLNEGAPLRSVQELLGHQNLSATQIYTSVSNERLRTVYLKNHPRAHTVKKK